MKNYFDLIVEENRKVLSEILTDMDYISNKERIGYSNIENLEDGIENVCFLLNQKFYQENKNLHIKRLNYAYLLKNTSENEKDVFFESAIITHLIKDHKVQNIFYNITFKRNTPHFDLSYSFQKKQLTVHLFAKNNEISFDLIFGYEKGSFHMEYLDTPDISSDLNIYDIVQQSLLLIHNITLKNNEIPFKLFLESEWNKDLEEEYNLNYDAFFNNIFIELFSTYKIFKI